VTRPRGSVRPLPSSACRREREELARADVVVANLSSVRPASAPR
jgi:nucleoside 2-deoxyribosyltransferase